MIPEREAAIERVLDILAPNFTRRGIYRTPNPGGVRIPIFEWGHETTPTEEELRKLAQDLVDAVLC
jgi:hypothetical protein